MFRELQNAFCRHRSFRQRISFSAMTIIKKRSFPPIVAPDARLLILGTLPGEESLRLEQYYGHPRNHFWPIIASVFGGTHEDDYRERCARLTKNKVALWDVLQYAERRDSLDSNIKNEVPNTFDAFFAQNPGICTIAFNGQKAHAFYRRYVSKMSGIAHDRHRILILPSTSPAYTRSFDEKAAEWRKALLTE
jgi:hypoxanthine-DNA glycosylase